MLRKVQVVVTCYSGWWAAVREEGEMLLNSKPPDLLWRDEGETKFSQEISFQEKDSYWENLSYCK